MTSRIQKQLNVEHISLEPVKHPLPLPVELCLLALVKVMNQTPEPEYHELFNKFSRISKGFRELEKRIKLACFGLGAPLTILIPRHIKSHADIEKITTRIAAYLHKHPPLNALNFSELAAIDDRLLSSCHQNLCSLSLPSFVLKERNIKDLTRCTNLTALNLQNCQSISDREFRHFTSLTRLVALDLRFLDYIRNQSLEVLTRFKALTELNLNYGLNIDDSGIAYLSTLTTLTSLTLSHCHKVTDHGIAHLSGLKNMTFLNLDGCTNLTNASVAHLIGLTSLTSIDLSHTKIADDSFKHLTQLTKLKALNLTSSLITHHGTIHLTGLTGLTFLALSGFGITDKSIESITKLKRLRDLQLCSCGVTDDATPHLTGLTNLTSIDFNGCEKITNASLSYLNSLPKLTYINIPMLSPQIDLDWLDSDLERGMK